MTHYATDLEGRRWEIRRAGSHGWSARSEAVNATLLSATLNEARRAVREFSDAWAQEMMESQE